MAEFWRSHLAANLASAFTLPPTLLVSDEQAAVAGTAAPRTAAGAEASGGDSPEAGACRKADAG
jgi:hypothetical protein